MSPGPIPKRSEERTRRNKENEAGIEVKKGEATTTTWPHAGVDWEKPIKDFYYGLKKSGMSNFYQQAEIQWAWIACDELNGYRQNGGGAMKLQAVLSMFSQGLGVTEGDRRRMQIELEFPKPEVEDEVDRKRREMQERLS